MTDTRPITAEQDRFLGRIIECIQAEEVCTNDLTVTLYFDMSIWGDDVYEDPDNLHPCGTTACIGGTAEILYLTDHIDKPHELAEAGIIGPAVKADEVDDAGKLVDPTAWVFENVGITDEAVLAEFMGLSYDEAQDLFYNNTAKDLTMELITPRIAVKALQDVRRTGRFTGWRSYIEAAYPSVMLTVPEA